MLGTFHTRPRRSHHTPLFMPGLSTAAAAAGSETQEFNDIHRLRVRNQRQFYASSVSERAGERRRQRTREEEKCIYTYTPQCICTYCSREVGLQTAAAAVSSILFMSRFFLWRFRGAQQLVLSIKFHFRSKKINAEGGGKFRPVDIRNLIRHRIKEKRRRGIRFAANLSDFAAFPTFFSLPNKYPSYRSSFKKKVFW